MKMRTLYNEPNNYWNTPQALWLGEWVKDVKATVDAAVTAAGTTQMRVFVAYNIPQRDCGSYSSGGAIDTVSYWTFIGQIAAGLKGRLAIVVLEPDSTALVDCLDEAALTKRLAMLSAAVDTLTAAGARVYIDAGSYNWIPAKTIAPRLIAAGVARARGFALNVSDSELTINGSKFAEELRAEIKAATGVGTSKYVIDVSRNGAGAPPGGEWCNPPSLRLGIQPTLVTGIPNCDGLLWIKRPGESDGLCNGGPEAGKWFQAGADLLALKP